MGGASGPLRRTIGGAGGKDVYPVAMYYFLVREAALRHDNKAAAANLAGLQISGTILRFKDLPANEMP